MHLCKHPRPWQADVSSGQLANGELEAEACLRAAGGCATRLREQAVELPGLKTPFTVQVRDDNALHCLALRLVSGDGVRLHQRELCDAEALHARAEFHLGVFACGRRCESLCHCERRASWGPWPTRGAIARSVADRRRGRDKLARPRVGVGWYYTTANP